MLLTLLACPSLTFAFFYLTLLSFACFLLPFSVLPSLKINQQRDTLVKGLCDALPPLADI